MSFEPKDFEKVANTIIERVPAARIDYTYGDLDIFSNTDGTVVYASMPLVDVKFSLDGEPVNDFESGTQELFTALMARNEEFKEGIKGFTSYFVFSRDNKGGLMATLPTITDRNAIYEGPALNGDLIALYNMGNIGGPTLEAALTHHSHMTRARPPVSAADDLVSLARNLPSTVEGLYNNVCTHFRDFQND